MRIATFNIENLDFPLEHRLAVLRPALERLEADIICLQEVNSQKVPNTSERQLRALEHLLDGTEYADFHRAETHSERHGGVASTHNLVTLSRYPIADNRQIWHQRVPPVSVHLCSVEGSDDPPTVVRFDRPFLVTAIDVNETRLHVFNVHLRAPLATSIPHQKISAFTWKSVGSWAEGYYLSGLKRTGQALEVRLVIDEIFDADETAHILVTGDFNAEEHETGPRIVAGAAEDTGNAELSGRSLVLLDRAMEPERRFSVIHYDMNSHGVQGTAMTDVVGCMDRMRLNMGSTADFHASPNVARLKAHIPWPPRGGGPHLPSADQVSVIRVISRMTVTK